MAQLNLRDLMAGSAPIVDAFDLKGGQEILDNEGQSQANINFSKRVMTEALPLTRMLSADGELDLTAIKKAKPFSDSYDIWDDLQSQMPANRHIDPVAFQQQVEMGQSLFDRNYANQIAQMQESGKSMKEIRNALKQNEEGLYDYAMQRGIIPREPEGWDWGNYARTGAMIGAGYAAEKGVRNLIPSKAPLSVQRELRQKGFKIVNKNGRPSIQRMTDMEIANRDKLAEWDELKKPKAQRRNIINKNKNLNKALQGQRGPTNKILEKGLNPKTGRLAKLAARASKFAKGKGMIGATVGVGAGLLADYLMQEK